MLSQYIALITCFATLIAASEPWITHNISIEPWNRDRSTWPANFDPFTFGLGVNNLLLVNSAFTYQAGDNVAIHTLEKQERGITSLGDGVLFDLKVHMRSGPAYLALHDTAGEMCSVQGNSAVVNPSGQEVQGQCGNDQKARVFQTPVWYTKDGFLAGTVLGEDKSDRWACAEHNWMYRSQSVILWMSDQLKWNCDGLGYDRIRIVLTPIKSK